MPALRHRSCLASLLVLLLGLAVAPRGRAGDAHPAPEITGRLVGTDGLPVLELWGRPHERGFAHGWLLAREIVDGAGASIAAFLGPRLPLYEGRMRPLARTAFRFDDDEREEIRGLLAGIEARLPDAADRTPPALGRPLDEEDLLLLNTFGDLYALGCSSLAVWGARTTDGRPAVVRNFDFPALDLVVTRQHVRVVAPQAGEAPRRGWVGLGHPGGIGTLTVMNDVGVFVAIHDVRVVPTLADLAQGNVPRLLAIRRLAERLDARGAVERAAALCRTWNTVYGNNVLVATPHAEGGTPAAVLEYDSREADDEGVDVRGAGADGGGLPGAFVVCTNHHRVRGTGTCWRYDALVQGVGGGESVLDVADLFRLGGSAAVPPPGAGIEPGAVATLHQVVALTGARTLHVRVAGLGGNVRDAREQAFDVRTRLAALPDGPAAPAPADGR